jgi:hypothetical protein
MPDGSISTGYYSDWEMMSDADKQTVMDTRKKNKAKGTTPTKRKVSNVKAQLAKLTKSIAANKLSNAAKEDNTSATDDPSVPDNAGNSFGGRNKKRHERIDVMRPSCLLKW